MINNRVIERIRALANAQNTSTVLYGKTSIEAAYDRRSLNSFLDALEVSGIISEYDFECDVDHEEPLISQINLHSGSFDGSYIVVNKIQIEN